MILTGAAVPVDIPVTVQNVKRVKESLPKHSLRCWDYEATL